MAMIDCPSCGKSISSQAEVCRHCNYSKNAPKKARKSKAMVYFHLITSTLLAAVGALLWVASANGNHVPEFAAFIAPYLLMGGAVWYVIARVWSQIK